MLKRAALSILSIFAITLIFGQSRLTEKYYSDEISAIGDVENSHRLTVFLIPSRVKYDWSSPKTLYKSLKKNYIRNILKKESYLLGHAFIELSTPLAGDDILTGMRADSPDEQKKYLFNDYYGLSILGADLDGRLEKSDDLDRKIHRYSRKGRLAFLTVLLSEEAAGRMVDFFRGFKENIASNGEAGARYGGAYYPRYYGEGAGCSAFAVAFLDAGGLLVEEYDGWKVEIDIPTDLMGGPYNEGNQVTLKDVRKMKHWADPEQQSRQEYEPFEIYDPTLMYEWVQQLWENPQQATDMQIEPVKIDKAKGVVIDGRNMPVPVAEPIFIEREQPSVFVPPYTR